MRTKNQLINAITRLIQQLDEDRLDALDYLVETLITQQQKWGEQNHSLDRWNSIELEELGEVAAATCKYHEDPDERPRHIQHALTEWVDVAAVAITAYASIHRQFQRGTQRSAALGSPPPIKAPPPIPRPVAIYEDNAGGIFLHASDGRILYQAPATGEPHAFDDAEYVSQHPDGYPAEGLGVADNWSAELLTLWDHNEPGELIAIYEPARARIILEADASPGYAARRYLDLHDDTNHD